MNKNTIIGLILIFGIFIAYSYLNQPSEQQLMKMKHKADSVNMANQIRHDSEITAAARQHAVDVARQKEAIAVSGVKLDSAALKRMSLRDELGAFSVAAVGKDTTYSIENDIFKIKISA